MQRDERDKRKSVRRTQGAEITRLPQEQIKSQTQWPAELESLRLEVESERRRTDHLFDRLGNAQPKFSHEACYCFSRPQPEASSERHSLEGQPVSGEGMRVIDLKIFWVKSPHSTAVNTGTTSGEDWQHGRIVIERIKPPLPRHLTVSGINGTILSSGSRSGP